MKILGIETSHDDTSIAIIEDGKVLDMWTISQIDIFREYGGTIPEIASREHVKNISHIQKLILEKYNLNEIDYIAYTKEPGLIGTLQIGYLFASGLSLAFNKPLIPVNHLHGHFLSSTLTEEITFPALCLLVSGGHTQIIYAKDIDEIEIVGETLDDAVGEAFDKVSSRLNLGFPGGPVIDQLASNYQGEYIKFTKPKTEHELDFSFSGLKTQVLNYVNKANMKNEKIDLIMLAVSFQKTAVEYLIEKTTVAINKYPDIKTLVLGGGVSANKELRAKFVELFPNTKIPSLKYATDNGAMIAQTAYLKIQKQIKNTEN